MASGLAVPGWAYNPGEDAAPDREPLANAKRLVPHHFDVFVPANDASFRYGLALHDAGFFWEAHEIWEAIWKAAPMNGRDRLALRALIQIANAGLKQRQARPRAAARLIEEARALLREVAARGGAAESQSVAAGLQGGILLGELEPGATTARLRLAKFFAQRV